MTGALFLASSTGPRPSVVIARGFPDYTGNLDIARSLQRAGYNVLSFNYRGYWGTPGTFTLSSALEDLNAAVRFLTTQEETITRRITGQCIFVLGYSLGGPIALRAAAEDTKIAGAILMDPTNLEVLFSTEDANELQWAGGVSSSVDIIADDFRRTRTMWSPLRTAQLGERPALLLLATGGNASNSVPLRETLATHSRETVLVLHTDHGFADQRVAVTRHILDWLDSASRQCSL